MNNRISELFFLIFKTFCLITVTAQSVWAQNSNYQQKRSGADYYREHVNKGTVGVISGGIAGTYIHIATDLSSVLDDNEGMSLRVLPIAGKAGVKNIRDLLYLKGIDIAIVQSDVLSAIEQKKTFRNIRNRVHYITKLYDAELHIIANKSIKKIKDLDGKTINFWQKGTSTEASVRAVFKEYGINAKVIFIDQNLAIDKVSKGEIAATALMVGKPVKRYTAIPSDANLHFLPIEYKGKLTSNYLPARLGNEHYPNLIAKGETISTISTAAVLAVYNWPTDHPRYKKVSRFVEAFFTNFEKFRKPPRHKKWRDVILTAKIPGWTRFKYAREWLQGKAKRAGNESQVFKQFLRSVSKNSYGKIQLTEEEQEKLFNNFLKWRQKSK